MQAGVHVFTTLTYKFTLNHGPGLVICERGKGKGKSLCKVFGAGEWMEMVAKQMVMMDARAACRAVLAKLAVPGAHGDGWTQGQTQTRASRHGVMAEAGKRGMARQVHAEQAAAAQQADR